MGRTLDSRGMQNSTALRTLGVVYNVTVIAQTIHEVGRVLAEMLYLH
jgi:hypothetical protein